MSKRVFALITMLALCLSAAHAESISLVGSEYSLPSAGYSLSVLWYADGDMPSDALLRDIQDLYFGSYPAMRETYGTSALKAVRIYLMDESWMPQNTPAFTSEGSIYCSRQFIEDSRGNLNVLVHELFHIVQNGYPQTDDPLVAALCDGMADMIRSQYGMFDDPAWSLTPYAEGQSYLDSYTVTGSFLLWITQAHDPAFCLRLNRVLHEGGDAAAAIQAITGFSIDELWAQYAQAPQAIQ